MSFKEFNQATDVSTQLAVINEIIPISGTAISGNLQVQHFINIVSGSSVSGGFWQTVWDGAPTSLSSSALVDFTFGISSASYEFTGTTVTFEAPQKLRVYNEMAALLNGSKQTPFSFNSVTYNDLFFIVFKRRIFKDEIQKGTMNITIQMSGGINDTLLLTDVGAPSAFSIGPAGDYASLFSGSTAVGNVYYDAGVIAFHTGVFLPPTNANNVYWSGSSNSSLQQVSITGSIDNVVDGFRNRIDQIQFNNQTNLHNTIYFARALNNEFNYSTNPTFVDSTGRIIPTSASANQTRTYICSVGLYDINNNLLAVAKSSTPVKKSPDNEVIFRVKLSY